MIKDKIVGVRFPTDVYERYARILREKGLSPSEVMRIAFVEYMHRHFMVKPERKPVKRPRGNKPPSGR